MKESFGGRSFSKGRQIENELIGHVDRGKRRVGKEKTTPDENVKVGDILALHIEDDGGVQKKREDISDRARLPTLHVRGGKPRDEDKYKPFTPKGEGPYSRSGLPIELKDYRLRMKRKRNRNRRNDEGLSN